MRIREDYLRILRLFRFHAWYGKGALDAGALAACVAEKSGLKLLSGERVQKELLRLLEAKQPCATLCVMKETGILAELLPAEAQISRLENLIAVELANGHAPDALLRLSALLPDGAAQARNVAEALKLSNAARDRLAQAAERDARIGAGLSPQEARKLLYRLGRDCFRDQLLLQWAAIGASADDKAWRALLALAEGWKAPLFALDGNDVMAAGLEEGPGIGKLLRDIEGWWVDQDFVPDRVALLNRLKQAIQKRRA